MNWFQHAVEALRALASKRWHGPGCNKSNCGSVCFCGPCHARVALEKLVEETDVARSEHLMTNASPAIPRGRWRILSKVSPSGKTLFVCLSCGNVSPGTSPNCSQPVKLWNNEMRECKDWKPSSFEVQ